MNSPRDTRPLFVISVAASLSGLHPQTLRVWERRGLVRPARTEGGRRRYSQADIARLERIIALSEQGINVAGIARILALEERIAHLEASLAAIAESAETPESP